MLRWKFIITRLVLGLAFLGFLRFGLDPLLRWGLIRAGQAATGAVVEVGKVQSHVGGASIYLGQVAVASPRRDRKNLVQFDHALLQLDGRALLKRRFVVRDGRVLGLVFDGERATSGRLPNVPEEPPREPAPSRLEHAGAAWWTSLRERLETDLENEFESVRLAQEFRERWPREYAAAEQRIEDGKRLVAQLREAYETLRQNPVQDPRYYQERLAELERLRDELRAARGEIDRLRNVVLDDKRRIGLAKEHDIAKVREKLHLDALDPQALAEYLLGPELNARIEAARRWMQQGRDVAAVTASKPKLNQGRGRGERVPFGRRDVPGFLVEKLLVEGRGTVDGRQFEFGGSVCDVASEPRWHPRPTVVRLATRGDIEAQFEATIDRRGDVPQERYVLSCPQLASPRRVLGDEQNMAFEVAESRGHLWVELTLANDDLRGQVVWKQESVQLTPLGAESLHGIRLREPLRVAAEHVRSLEAVCDVSGSWKKPELKLQSNLGTQLSAGLSTALRQELERRAGELTQQAEEKVAALLGQFEPWVAEKEKEIAQRLRLHELELDGLYADLRGRLPLPANLLGQRGGQIREGLERRGFDALKSWPAFGRGAENGPVIRTTSGP